MNKQAQAFVRGMAFLTVGFVFFLVLFATIDPFKEQLDSTRNQTALNCPGTPGHDATDYGNDTDFEKLVRRPTCFVTGLSMVYFLGACMIAVVVWIGVNWRKTK